MDIYIYNVVTALETVVLENLALFYDPGRLLSLSLKRL